MSATSEPVARRVEYSDGGFAVWTWCPGCEAIHPVTIEDPSGRINRGVTWEWDGDLERPTFSPSLLVHSAVHLCDGEHQVTPCPGDCDQQGHALGALVDGTWVLRNLPDHVELERVHIGPHPRKAAWGSCHSFLRGGRWEFLSDSAHHLAGQTVDMVPLPAAWRADPEETP